MWSSFKGTRCADFSSLLMCSLFTSYKITGAQSHTFKSIQNMVLFSKSLLFSFLKVNLPPCFFPSQDFTLFSRSCFPFPTPQCCVWPEHWTIVHHFIIKQCFIAKQQKFTWISTTRKYKKEKVHFLKVSISSPLEHIVEPIIHLTRIVQFDLIANVLSTNGWFSADRGNSAYTMVPNYAQVY